MATLSLPEAAQRSVEAARQAADAYQPTDAEQAFHGALARRFRENQDEMDAPDAGLQVGISLLDRMISTVELDAISADIWMEDENDIMLHVLPSRGARLFEPFEMARQQWNNVARKHFVDVPGVQCLGEYFGFRTGDIFVQRKSDRRDSGRDMFQLRAIGLWRRPHAAVAAVDFVRHYDDVLCFRSVPVE